MADKTGLAMQQEDGMKTPKRSWRKSILCQLRQRNQKEITPFQDLIQVHNRIVERISSLQMENTQLGFINERLKNEIQNLKISPGGYSNCRSWLRHPDRRYRSHFRSVFYHPCRGQWFRPCGGRGHRYPARRHYSCGQSSRWRRRIYRFVTDYSGI